MPTETALTGKTDQVSSDGLLSQIVLIFLHILHDTQQEIDNLKFSISVLKKKNQILFFLNKEILTCPNSIQKNKSFVSNISNIFIRHKRVTFLFLP